MKVDYLSEYKKKLRTAQEIIDMIEDGFYISAGQFAGSPQALYAQLHNLRPNVKNVTLQASLMAGSTPEMDAPEMDEHISWEAWFYGARERKLALDGRISYVPSHLSQAGERKLSYKKPDMFWGVSAPMDAHGNLNVAYSIAYEMDMLENAKIVVLEVNKNAPRTFGENTVPLSHVDFIVESDLPRLASEPTQPDEIDIAIGRHIASLVEDRSTIQLGIGNIPNAVASCLMDKKDLGVHTELITDSMMELYKAGVITNKYKGIYRDKIVGTLVFGGNELYNFIDNNPVVEFKRGSIVNDPFVIMQNENMVSINTAIQVDLTGQVSSESIGSRQYSGIGGQFDTAYGAQRSKNGKSIIAMHSTAKGGKVSTIVTQLSSGCIVSLSRNDVDYVVTEYGIASLRGRSIRERSKALIAIAHPDYRQELTAKAQELRLI